MRTTSWFLIPLFLLSSCGKGIGPQNLQEEFDAGQRLLFSQRRPLDSLLLIGPEELSRWDSFYQSYRHRLDGAPLPEEDRRALNRALEETASRIQHYRHDPSAYNLGGALKQVLAAEQIPLSRRLKAIKTQMEQAPRYYECAKANIFAPIPERCRLAAQKQRLTLDFLNNELQDSLGRLEPGGEEARQFQSAVEEARLAVKDYLAFCESLYFEHQDSLINRNQ